MPRHLLIVVSSLLTGCLDPESATCRSGLRCPPGYACDDEAQLCVLPGAAVCGNGRVEIPEECDDGNRRSRDGCTSLCEQETLTWTPLETASEPSPRQGAALTWDASNDSVWVAGGQGSDGLNTDLWHFSNGRWREVALPRGEPTALAPLHLPKTGLRLAMEVEGTFEVWALDGSPDEPVWRLEGKDAAGGGVIHGATAADDKGAFVYRRVVDNKITTRVLRRTPASGNEDVAYWSGYSLLFAVSEDMRAAWQPSKQQLVAVEPDGTVRRVEGGGLLTSGGLPAPLVALTDGPVALVEGGASAVYLLGSDGWEVKSTVTPPPAKTGFSAITANSGLVMFGGVADDALISALWLAPDGERWERVESLAAPGPRLTPAVTWDRRARRMVLHGGRDAGGVRTDTWHFAQDMWTRVSSDGPAVENAAMGYDDRNDRVILRSPDGSWQLSEAGALRLEAEASEGAAAPVRAIPFDTATETLRAVGDTHETLTDVRWQPAVSPPGRVGAAAFDRARRTVVAVESGGAGRTWVLDGDTWTTHTAGPPAVEDFAMAWDPSREVVVLHGGRRDGKVQGAVWQWDGAHWTALPDGPPKAEHRLVYDESERRLLSAGGTGPDVLWAAAWVGPGRLETCLGAADIDGDSLIGCEDPDCAWRWDCEPHVSCGVAIGDCLDTLACTAGRCESSGCAQSVTSGCAIDHGCYTAGAEGPPGCICAPAQSRTAWTCEPIHPCGNGELDPGEECDDSGRTSGDGCSEDCLAESRCVVVSTITGGFESVEVTPDGLLSVASSLGGSDPIAAGDVVRPQALTAWGRDIVAVMPDDSLRWARVAMDGALSALPAATLTPLGVPRAVFSLGDDLYIASVVDADTLRVTAMTRSGVTSAQLIGVDEAPLVAEASAVFGRVEPHAGGHRLSLQIVVGPQAPVLYQVNVALDPFDVMPTPWPEPMDLAEPVLTEAGGLTSVRAERVGQTLREAFMGPCFRGRISGFGSFKLCDGPFAGGTVDLTWGPTDGAFWVTATGGGFVRGQLSSDGIWVESFEGKSGRRWLQPLFEGAVILAFGETGGFETIDSQTGAPLDSLTTATGASGRQSAAVLPCYIQEKP